MGTPLGPKYLLYTYMDPLGKQGLHNYCSSLSCSKDGCPSTKLGLRGVTMVKSFVNRSSGFTSKVM